MRAEVYLDKYSIGDGIGAWAKSHENGIEVGHVRVIGGVLMYAWSIKRRLIWPDEIWWTPVDKEQNNYDRLRVWKGSLTI